MISFPSDDDPTPAAVEAFSLALERHRAGDFMNAVTGFRRVIALDPRIVEAYYNIGIDLFELGAYEPAAAAYRAAIALKPDFPKAYNNLGTALMRMDHAEEAVQAFNQAITLAPGLVEPHSNLGLALEILGRLDDAIAVHRHAVSLDPTNADAINNLGKTLTLQGHCEEGLRNFAEAIAQAPDYLLARLNYALTLLKLGRWREGWDAYEWRTRQYPARSQPQWEGGPLAGRTLLLESEQGYGDTLQFVRYLPLIVPRDGRVLLRVPAALVSLLRQIPGVDLVFADTEPLPPYDCHLCLMSLPRLAGTTIATIPANIPYLTADPSESARWNERLSALPGRKVGLVWAGKHRRNSEETARVDRRRSLSPAAFLPFTQIPGVSLISLQKEPPLAPPAFHDWMAEIDDFKATAGLLSHLDLVITVDTAMAHLAGAMGKPVWILSRFDGCWRWLEGRDDTPWYPTARLFRQIRYNDWADPLARVYGALREFSS